MGFATPTFLNRVNFPITKSIATRQDVSLYALPSAMSQTTPQRRECLPAIRSDHTGCKKTSTQSSAAHACSAAATAPAINARDIGRMRTLILSLDYDKAPSTCTCSRSTRCSACTGCSSGPWGRSSARLGASLRVCPPTVN